MGDRTDVTLTVLETDREATINIIESAGHWSLSIYKGNANSRCFCYFEFEEVNYGELPFLNLLVQAGIPFDSSWEYGAEYAPGTTSCRFLDNGHAQVKNNIPSDPSIAITALLARIDKPAELIQYIRDKEDEFAVLPWDNQEENKKTYRTLRLLGGIS